jgi:hypothetical protein
MREIDPIVDDEGPVLGTKAIEDGTGILPLVINVDNTQWSLVQMPDERQKTQVEKKTSAAFGILDDNLFEKLRVVAGRLVVAVLDTTAVVLRQRMCIEVCWRADRVETTDSVEDF